MPAVFFTIRLEEGTYTLTEVLPTGYFGPGTVQVTVAQNTGGNISYHAEAKALPEGITPSTGSWLQNADADNVVILNVPRMLISVTARSSWPATGDKLPVTVELWRDGAPLTGDAYTVELNKENEWQYTWENLPLFTDGTVADYTLREIEIGDTYRDPGVAEDGFADYLVTYAKALYRQAEDKEYREEHWWQKADGTQCFAREALLVVNNEGIRGEIAFEKVDEKGYPLKGAEFTLYADAECTKRLATATSDETAMCSLRISGRRHLLPAGDHRPCGLHCGGAHLDGEDRGGEGDHFYTGRHHRYRGEEYLPAAAEAESAGPTGRGTPRGGAAGDAG